MIEGQVVPASVELPNVSVMEAMVDMITASRAFESYTKTAQTMDQLNQEVIRLSRING